MILDRILAGAAVAFLVAAGVQTWRLSSERQAHADTRTQAAEATARAAAEALAWSRALQQSADTAREHAHEQQQTIDQQARTIADLQRRLVRLDADARGLRDQLAAYAAGGAGDTAATCQQRASRLAELLAEGAELVREGSALVATCGELARESARAAHQRAVDQDALINAWPREVTP